MIYMYNYIAESFICHVKFFFFFKQQKLMCIKKNKKDSMITLQDIKAPMQQINNYIRLNMYHYSKSQCRIFATNFSIYDSGIYDRLGSADN